MKAMGIPDLLNFDFMDPPPAETLLTALRMLHALESARGSSDLTRKKDGRISNLNCQKF